MKRSAHLQRRTPLKRVSKKTRKLRALVNPGRKGFVELAGCCMVCRQRKAVDCHEICRGPAREKCLLHPRLWLAVCRRCHVLLDDTAAWPIERQIAVRIAWERSQTVAEANGVLGSPDTYITTVGVLELECELEW